MLDDHALTLSGFYSTCLFYILEQYITGSCIQKVSKDIVFSKETVALLKLLPKNLNILYSVNNKGNISSYRASLATVKCCRENFSLKGCCSKCP